MRRKHLAVSSSATRFMKERRRLCAICSSVTVDGRFALQTYLTRYELPSARRAHTALPANRGAAILTRMARSLVESTYATLHVTLVLSCMSKSFAKRSALLTRLLTRLPPVCVLPPPKLSICTYQHLRHRGQCLSAVPNGVRVARGYPRSKGVEVGPQHPSGRSVC